MRIPPHLANAHAVHSASSHRLRSSNFCDSTSSVTLLEKTNADQKRAFGPAVPGNRPSWLRYGKWEVLRGSGFKVSWQHTVLASVTLALDDGPLTEGEGRQVRPLALRGSKSLTWPMSKSDTGSRRKGHDFLGALYDRVSDGTTRRPTRARCCALRTDRLLKAGLRVVPRTLEHVK